MTLTTLNHWCLRSFILLQALDALTTGLVCYAIGPVGESNRLALWSLATFGILDTVMLKFIGAQIVLVNADRLGTTRLWMLNLLMVPFVVIGIRWAAMVGYVLALAT